MTKAPSIHQDLAQRTVETVLQQLEKWSNPAVAKLLTVSANGFEPQFDDEAAIFGSRNRDHRVKVWRYTVPPSISIYVNTQGDPYLVEQAQDVTRKFLSKGSKIKCPRGGERQDGDRLLWQNGSRLYANTAVELVQGINFILSKSTRPIPIPDQLKPEGITRG